MKVSQDDCEFLEGSGDSHFTDANIQRISHGPDSSRLLHKSTWDVIGYTQTSDQSVLTRLFLLSRSQRADAPTSINCLGASMLPHWSQFLSHILLQSFIFVLFSRLNKGHKERDAVSFVFCLLTF